MSWMTAADLGVLKDNIDAMYRVYGAVNDLAQEGHELFPATPRNYGYRENQFLGELFAETMRMAALQPNWLKTYEPELARTIAALINSNPDLAPWLQIN